MKRKLVFGAGVAAVALVSLAWVTGANAALLVDRGLPTINLNNSAGANRSNVAWTETGYSPANYWMVGDTFANTSSKIWFIDTIRLWTVGATSAAALWGGIDGSSIGLVSGSGTISNAAYADSSTYQGYSGTYRDMHQVDFAVDIALAAGQTYDFFLDGTGGDYGVPFVHASNAALSGSPQVGANDSLLEANVVGGSVASVDAWTSLGNGWDKGSDVNVQAFGSVPEPATYAMLIPGLGLLGFMGRRRKQKKAA